MPTNVIMPQLGESVVEGTISKWLKQEGDSVEAFEPLLEISTDKVDTEVSAPADGVLLKIHVAEGETVEKGTLLAVIGVAGEKIPATPAASPTQVGARTSSGRGEQVDGRSTMDQPVEARPDSPAFPEAVPAHTNGKHEYTGHVTPVVARMAAEHHLNLAQIEGTGREGRITKKDVEAYLAGQPSAEAVAVAAQSAAPSESDEVPPWEQPVSGDLFKPTVEYEVAPLGVKHASPAQQRVHPVEPIPAAVDGELIALSPMRKAIAEHMVRSKLQTSPHVTTVFEVDLSAVLAHREANKAAYAKQGVNLTLTAYFAAASVEALRAVPLLNAQWTDEGIYLHHNINVGLAVGLDDGLIVPVIKRAGDLSLLGIARAVNDLAARARAKQLKPDEVQGGTFTITNHGVSGSLFATPIINQPQVGILGVGLLEKRVKVITDADGHDSLVIRPCVYVTLTFDHRVADGATGDGFMLALKQRLEGWT